MKHERLKKFALWRLIGLVIVTAAICWAGPSKVWAVLSQTDFKFVSAAISFAIPMALIKGLRWKILLQSYDINLSYRDSTAMYAIGLVLSAVTPGRVGDLIKIVLLTKKGYRASKAVASNIFDRLFDVGFVALAGYTGMWYFSKYFASQLNIINIAFLVVLCLGAVFVVKRHLIKNLAIKLVPLQYRDTARQSWNEIVSTLSQNNIRGFLQLIFWTIIFWFVQFYALYLCTKALRIEVPFIYFSACAAVAMVLSLLPITVAGIGTRDAVFILLLGQIGIAKQQSLALSALILAVFLINCIVFYAISVLASPTSNPPLKPSQSSPD